ncbi:hypothetical protein COO60DRAFT_1108069 [Scenedesmus sp. NREL 46B-D3]|nr:hypothetical protein COO60DRAFT_1108069 [Scenedesmus sp. NREL 46B-D3]
MLLLLVAVACLHSSALSSRAGVCCYGTSPLVLACNHTSGSTSEPAVLALCLHACVAAACCWLALMYHSLGVGEPGSFEWKQSPEFVPVLFVMVCRTPSTGWWELCVVSELLAAREWPAMVQWRLDASARSSSAGGGGGTCVTHWRYMCDSLAVHGMDRRQCRGSGSAVACRHLTPKARVCLSIASTYSAVLGGRCSDSTLR